MTAVFWTLSVKPEVMIASIGLHRTKSFPEWFQRSKRHTSDYMRVAGGNLGTTIGEINYTGMSVGSLFPFLKPETINSVKYVQGGHFYSGSRR